MHDHPILFNGDMVRAILDGRKTQTRRVIKPQPVECHADYPKGGFECHHEWKGVRLGGQKEWFESHCPYGKAGDRLWVRETWVMDELWTEPETECIAYKADLTIREVSSHPYVNGHPTMSLCAELPFKLDGDKWQGQSNWTDKWKPSIHMPRWASRIALEVTDVRVERVQAITPVDAYSEGADGGPWIGTIDYVEGFRRLWDDINGKPRKDGTDISWDANPWVWVVTFKHINRKGGEERAETMQTKEETGTGSGT